MDDIIIIESSIILIQSIITQLDSQLRLKDLDGLNYFMRIECALQVDSIHLNQRKYMQELLDRYDFIITKSCDTLMTIQENFMFV